MKQPMSKSFKILILTISCFGIGFISGQNNMKSVVNFDNINEMHVEGARNSYLKGCVVNSETHFSDCVEKAKAHQEEIREILNKEVQVINVKQPVVPNQMDAELRKIMNNKSLTI